MAANIIFPWIYPAINRSREKPREFKLALYLNYFIRRNNFKVKRPASHPHYGRTFFKLLKEKTMKLKQI